MKKAKIILTAIGVFALVGGALAFKANRGGALFCATAPAAAGACNNFVPDYTITALAGAPYVGYCTTHPLAPCPALVGAKVLL
jgi:hypothetical protein